MRKRVLAALMILLVLMDLTGCVREASNNKNVAFFGNGVPTASATPAPSPTPLATPDSTADDGDVDWTVMIYLNGSNLESENGEASRNLQSLLNVDLSENVTVLVYTGGTAKWQNSNISSSNNQIWLVKDHQIELLESYNRQNIGSSATLAQFIKYGQSYAPYDRKALILWDHGGGSIQGFGVDEFYDSDGLYLYELSDAMKQGTDGVSFDLIGFDACLMASAETASVFAPYATTLVASEESEPGGGWDYYGVFNQLSLNPSMTGEKLGITVADSYYKKYSHTTTEGYITCSVIDLTKMDELEKCLGDFAAELTSAIVQPTAMLPLSAARQNAESYGDEPGAVSFDMVDLYHFVELQTTAADTDTTALMNAIDSAVVYEVSGSQRINSYGLSIYFPYLAKDYFDYCLQIYDRIDFCPEYQTFVSDFAECLTDPAYMDDVPEYSEAVFEVPEIGHGSDYSEVGSYYVQLTDEQLEYLGEVYCTLGWYWDDGTLVDLGDDRDLTFDETDNTLHDDFDGSWTGLNGMPAALYILEETDDYLLYNIPILYNGKRAVVKCAWIWDDSNESNGYYVVNGVFLTNNETSLPDTRMEVIVQPGATITMIYSVRPDKTEYVEGGSFTVTSSGLSLDLISLPEGVYQYGFKFIDIYGNVHYSEFVDIPVSYES